MSYKINNSRYINENRPVIFVYTLLFLSLFILTALTPMVGDDYPYSFNWANWTRIESLSDIVESMTVHRSTTNGRVFTHGLVQLFLLWPRIIYCFLNAANTLLLCILSRKLLDNERWQDTVSILLFGIFFIACFTPALGENYLWLDGSINYSWGLGFDLLYLMPFFLDFLNRPLKLTWKIALPYCILGVWVGGYAESSSLIVLSIAGFLWLCNWHRNRKCDYLFLFWLICALLGYYYLMSAPSTSGRASSFSFAAVGYNIREVFRIAHDDLLWTYLIFAVLLTLSIWFQAEKKLVYLSLILFFGGLASLSSYIFAKYIEPRHLCFPVFFTMLSCMLLLSALCLKKQPIYSRIILACVSVLFALQFPVGVLDVAISYHKQQVRLQQIQEALDTGETRVTLENYFPYTSYAIGFVMNNSNPSYGPNVNIADYYGIKEVYGIDPD